MSYDYLSIPDEKLVDLLQVVHDITKAHLADWYIYPAELADWEPELAAFTDAVNTLKEPANRSPVTVRIKNDARDALKAKVRPFIQGRLVRNPRVTPADLIAMGLSVRDTHLTPKQRPHRRPALNAKPADKRQHAVSALNQDTGEKTNPVTPMSSDMPGK